MNIPTTYLNNSQFTIQHNIEKELDDKSIDYIPLKLKVLIKHCYMNQLVEDFYKPFDCVDNIITGLLQGYDLDTPIEELIKTIKFNCELDDLGDLVTMDSSLDDLDDLLDNNWSSERTNLELSLLQI